MRFEFVINALSGKPSWDTPEVEEPRYRVVEEPAGYKLYVEMPGAKKDSIRVYANESMVYISSEVRDDLVVSGRRYKLRVRLGSKIDPNRVKARYEDGVLVVEALKREGAVRVPIE